MKNTRFAILMAGGVGSRFWPVSTSKKPKQFRDLLGSGETLLQTTFSRIKKIIPVENIFILTNSDYKDLIHEQLPEVKSAQLILEPVMRNTAPAVLFAALKIKHKAEDSAMVMVPTDHWIENEASFISDLDAAFNACEKYEGIVTLGVKPAFPNTGFGYIEFQPGPEKVKQVLKFTEKPTFEVAREFIKQGNYFWNAGIFIWKTETILKAFEEYLPETNKLFSSGIKFFDTSEEQNFIEEYYPKAENISIDYAILEKADNISMIAASFDWNDLGTWGSVYNEMEKDENSNVVLKGRISAENSSGNIISSAGNKVVVVEGINDYIIIDEEEILLLVPKSKEQEIKEIRGNIQKKFGDNLG